MVNIAGKKRKSTKIYKYKTFKNDVLKTRLYTLKNGLEVYLTENKDEPRINTAIAFRAGSKNDPPETTGLAHYMEHMLFKGTADIGTTNWKEEKVLLDKIAALYEEHLNTKSSKKKKEIYKKIDDLSQQAAELAIPNEYDKIVSALGAKGTNAYTSTEKTVYLNDIPSNELEKWLIVESNRFKKLVLRLFHTEMETVYEEFNRSLDNDYVKSWRSIYEGLYQKHPYGIPVIGLGEHLKNPSMNNIYDYFYAHYRPNNAAICISGDLDPEKTIAMIDQYFGDWEPTEIPPFTFKPEAPIKKPIVKKNYGTQTDHLYFAYRFDGAASHDPTMTRLVGGLLFNEIAGLFDTNLMQKQKVLQAYSFEMMMRDYSHHVFFGLPKQGQSLEEVRDLMLAEIEKLKRGEFEDWLIPAVVNHLKYKRVRGFRTNKARTGFLVEVFTLDVPYEEAIDFYENMAKVTKQQVIDFVKEHYNDNYVIAYKHQGVDESLERVDKPDMTPIPINRNVNSEFFEELFKKKSSRLKPKYLDFNKELKKHVICKGETEIPFYYIKNKKDDTFKLYYIFDIGKRHNNKLSLALSYLSYLGTDEMDISDVQKEFFKLGLEYKTVCHARKSYIILEGLGSSLEEGIKLIENLIKNVKVDVNAYQQLVGDTLKKRADQKLAKDTVLHNAMFNYVIYGESSPFTDILSEEELLSLDPRELVKLIKSLFSHEINLFFNGVPKADEIVDLMFKHHHFPAKVKKSPKRKVFKEKVIDKNEVFLMDFDQTQVEIVLVTKKGLFNKDIIAHKNIFNEYFGAGLSSIIFQEIREAKALAYSAYAWYTSPDFKDKSHYIKSYIGTQPDKLEEAVDVFLRLMNDMPKAQQQFLSAKDAALKRIESERIIQENIFWTYQEAVNRGLENDNRKRVYDQVANMTIDDLEEFFNREIKGSKFSYLVLGNTKLLDKKILKKLGPITELKSKQIFGY